jgi:hypothetical protein
MARELSRKILVIFDTLDRDRPNLVEIAGLWAALKRKYEDEELVELEEK